VGLTDEHIIPYALGGNVQLLQASCKSCARITGALEGYVGRKVLWDFRVHAKSPTRRPGERPDVLPARISMGEGEAQTLELPIGDHPYFMPMPVWGMPGLLAGTPPSDRFAEENRVHLYWYVPPTLRQALNLADGELAQIHPPDVQVDNHRFARAIATIAYCQAVARWGVKGFRRVVMPNLILGTYPLVPYFVGCELKNPPPPMDRKAVHMVDLRIVTIGRLRLIVGSVRLFANSGTKDQDADLSRYPWCSVPDVTSHFLTNVREHVVRVRLGCFSEPQDLTKHSQPLTLAIAFHISIFHLLIEDRLDDPQISALSPAIGPTFPTAGPERIAMVAPVDERVGNIRRDHLHRPCHAPDRRSGPLAGKATVFIIQRPNDGGTRRTAGSIVHTIAAQGGGRVPPVIAMNASPQGWASRALWLMFAISAAWAVYVFGSHYGSCRAD
jgi:hypothetical protein